MSTIFGSTVQPATVSLFSSTGSQPLYLFESAQDDSLPTESFIHLLNDTSSEPIPESPRKLISPPSIESDVCDGNGYSLCQTVLHIQSPTLQATYIKSKGDLGLNHPWFNLQVRTLGREWSFEIGIVDRMKRVGVIRLSTFQKSARLKLPVRGKPALLHLPLPFPMASESSHLLTAWSTVTLNLPSLMPHFSDLSLLEDNGDARRSLNTVAGAFSHISYVKIYSTCRLRRIWFSQEGPGAELPWEFQLYSDA
ncbi:uncharacterized protein BT62DRAFT_929563 [Guyanagaster necrorhizus]|uniref:CFA20 domain-containing protein n=1 Tax=Guyanagaster necrorhizus TaxID=856835 RepID=A0A9P7VWY5_9AGAR|nr:uncharacterized protein BT62DRAFT_929563 [Guyanagaster necrorhizus MCA 3950]KAG7448479.1 hypothetical protein BT62DRAFT_929563 [Guyanagaster necrorhizus MCA 3950]